MLFLTDRSPGDKRVAGRSSQRGGHPLLQPLPRPEPGAPHAAAHNHTQRLHLQTLSQNGTTSPPVYTKTKSWCLSQPLSVSPGDQTVIPALMFDFKKLNISHNRILRLWFCWFQEALTLRKLWAVGYQVIVSYEHNIASCHSELWPHVPYWWANKCKAEALIEEFEHRKQHGRPGNLLRDYQTQKCRSF